MQQRRHSSLFYDTMAGTPVPELSRTHGISSTTFYKWWWKFGGMEASMMPRLKELEDENRRLRKIYAEAHGRWQLCLGSCDHQLSVVAGQDQELAVIAERVAAFGRRYV